MPEHSETAPIYFDHAAAAPVLPEVWREAQVLAPRWFANPEAAHGMAVRLRAGMRDAGEAIARTLFTRPPRELAVHFAGSASEIAAHLSLLEWRGAAAGSVLDHPALQALRRRAFRAGLDLPLDGMGVPELPEHPDRAAELVTVSQVQSETGLCCEWETHCAAVRRAFPEALILLDMVQAAGKKPKLTALPDLALISGHKFGAPGGAALLMLSARARRLAGPLTALRHRDYLSGRDEPLAVKLLECALTVTAERREETSARVKALGEMLRSGLEKLRIKGAPAVRFLFPAERVSPYILHFLLPGYDTGVIVRMLSERGIMVAAGSACRSESGEPSAVLRALGLSRELAYSGLRLSFGAANTAAEAERFLAVFPEVLQDY